MANKTTWPFAKMAVGEECVITEKHIGLRGQTYVHVYGRATGKTFSSWSDRDGIHFKRLS